MRKFQRDSNLQVRFSGPKEGCYNYSRNGAKAVLLLNGNIQETRQHQLETTFLSTHPYYIKLAILTSILKKKTVARKKSKAILGSLSSLNQDQKGLQATPFRPEMWPDHLLEGSPSTANGTVLAMVRYLSAYSISR